MNNRPIDDHRTGLQALAQQLYRKDPLLVLVRDKLHIGLGWSILTIAVLFIVALVGIPLLFKAPFDKAPLRQSLFATVIQAAVVMPVILALYWLMPDYLARLFATLEKKDLVGESRQTGGKPYNRFLVSLVATVNDWRWMALALASVVCYWGYRLELFGQVPADYTQLMPLPEWARLLMRLLLLLVYSPVTYGGILAVIKFLVGLVFSYRFFDLFKIKVNPLDPDGAGGCGVIGQMLVSSVLILTVFGVAAVSMAILDLSQGTNPAGRPEVFAFGAIYLFMTPMLFISWLWLPHRAMVEARDEILHRLADEFRQTMCGSFPSRTDTAEAIKTKTDRLEEVQRQYKLISETFPIWPLRTHALRSLVGTSVLPLISSLVSGFFPAIRAAVLTLLGAKQP